MKRNILLALGALFVAAQLSGCVIESRPYHGYYWHHGYYYR